MKTPIAGWIRENKRLVRFLSICLGAYLLWIVLYHLWLGPSQQLDHWLSDVEAQEVAWLLRFMGYPVEQVLELGFKQTFYLHDERLIGLASSCNGLVLFPLFSCFVLATQGHWTRKVIYCSIGCLLIYHVNILRITGLALVKIYSPDSLAFNHKYTFTVMVYSFIFFLWYLWINVYSKPRETTHA